MSPTAEKKVEKSMQEYKLNEALEAIWELIRFGDRYLNEHKPWALPADLSAEASAKEENLKAESKINEQRGYKK